MEGSVDAKMEREEKEPERPFQNLSNAVSVEVA